jgi:flagellar assembly protein FliH
MSRVEVFEYPAGPDAPPIHGFEGWGGQDASGGNGHTGRQNGHGPGDSNAHTEFENRLAEETRKSFEAGRERGRLEGRQAEREALGPTHAAAEAQRMRQTVELVESFAQERDKYLHAVEREVVELALAVAARILRREAQMDPLLLTGAVRVALGQLSGSTQVKLIVPPAELGLWTETIALLPRLSVKPEVVAGEGMRQGDCMIETGLGSVDLGVRAQLGEIERGFFDRAGGSRPVIPSGTEAAASGREGA